MVDKYALVQIVQSMEKKEMGKNEELAKKIFSVIRMENAKERIVLQVAHPMDKLAMGKNEEHAKNILSVTRMETAKERMLGSLPMLQAQVARQSRNYIPSVHLLLNHSNDIFSVFLIP